MTLANLEIGVTARISKIEGDARTVARLESMGLHPGCLVSRKSQALNGGPVVVERGSTQLALGAALAARIQVTVDNEG